MRNCLFVGQATRFMKEEARTKVFLDATGGSLNEKTMRDREFVNRFCAFKILDIDEYHGDMDEFLAHCLKKMNRSNESELSRLSDEFHRGLANNLMLFDQHAFRKHGPERGRRSVLNASLWDVMSTGLSRYAEEQVETNAGILRLAFYELLKDEEFNNAITYGTNDTRRVRRRFEMTTQRFEEILCAHKN